MFPLVGCCGSGAVIGGFLLENGDVLMLVQPGGADHLRGAIGR